jgi:hypothetical protein
MGFARQSSIAAFAGSHFRSANHLIRQRESCPFPLLR